MILTCAVCGRNYSAHNYSSVWAVGRCRKHRKKDMSLLKATLGPKQQLSAYELFKSKFHTRSITAAAS